jgi:polysaccharide pyruvyl transferase WcaK-like protein
MSLEPHRRVIRALRPPILIVGGYGYRNLGDEAILAGLLNLLGPGRQATVLSRDPAGTRAMHGVPAVGPGGLARVLSEHQSVLIGGGGLFAGGMGRLGRLIAPFGLAMVTTGRPVAIVGVGADAGAPASTRLALRALAPHLAGLTVRDAPSASILASWGIPSSVGDDLAAALPAAGRDDGRDLLVAAGLDLNRPIVGLCLTSLGDARVRARLEPAVRTLAAELRGVQLALVPMSQHPRVSAHNDLILAERLRVALPRLAIIEGVHHPSTVVAAFGWMSAAICMRYHSLWFASKAGTPVVAVPYAAKCWAWLAERGMEGTPLDGRALADAVRAAIGSRLARPA